MEDLEQSGYKPTLPESPNCAIIVSTWRGIDEPSRTNTKPLNELEPRANNEFSGYGEIVSTWRGVDEPGSRKTEAERNKND